MRLQRLTKIVLYDEGTAQTLNLEEIAAYLREKLRKAEVELRGNPFAFYLYRDRLSDYASKIACIKIQDATRRMLPEQEPLYGEIEYEKRRILGKTRAFGVLYDGFELQRIFWEFISRPERNFEFVHILFTNRLFATWDERDSRYHARVSVYSQAHTCSRSL